VFVAISPDSTATAPSRLDPIHNMPARPSSDGLRRWLIRPPACRCGSDTGQTMRCSPINPTSGSGWFGPTRWSRASGASALA